jgi:hypothetical protein
MLVAPVNLPLTPVPISLRGGLEPCHDRGDRSHALLTLARVGGGRLATSIKGEGRLQKIPVSDVRLGEFRGKTSPAIPRFMHTLTNYSRWLVLICLFCVRPPAPMHAAPAELSPDTPWKSLFNDKDFTGWDKYLAPPPGSQTPLGLNRDPRNVFTITNVDGAPAIRVSGEIYGAITTHDEFDNVHIRLEYKWGEKKWPPRDSPRHYRDSGILYWCIGAHGAGSASWMRSVECNIMEKGVGQWWSVAGVYCDSWATKLVLDRAPWVPYRGESDGELCYVYQPGFPYRTVPASDGITASMDYEKPGWNVCEVIAWGNLGIHVLNGKVNLVVANPRYREGNRELRLSRGKIQLQSEAAEVYYRKIEARPITEVPLPFLNDLPSPSDDEPGFTPLLQGAAAGQWLQSGPGKFALADGIATGEGGMGLWWHTNRTYTNFVLRGEWRQDQDIADSGVFFRFPNPGNDPWVAVRQGHEMEIGDPKPAKATDATGAIYPFHAPALVPVKPYGEWNSYEITAVGHNYSVSINGRWVNTWTDVKNRSLAGYIGLQNYNDGKTVKHRNLRIKDLP